MILGVRGKSEVERIQEMSGLQFCIAALGAIVAISALLQAPRLIVMGVLAFIRLGIARESRAIDQALLAPRAPSNDPWSPISRTDRRLLSRSLALSMRSTGIASALPAALG